MKRRNLRAAVTLADEAERRIRAAGAAMPARADLISVFVRPARALSAAAREHQDAERALADAERRRDAVAEYVSGVLDQVVTAWIGEAPPQPRYREFDPSVHRVELVTRDGEPVREAS